MPTIIKPLRWFSYRFLILLIISCGNDERAKYDSLPYTDVLTSLVMENTDLQAISKFTSVSIEDIIKMKYGIIAENEEMTKYLRDLKYAYDTNDASDVEELLEKHVFEISHKQIGKSLPKGKYKELEYFNNEKFQERLPVLCQEFLNKQIDEYIENKFSYKELAKNTWNYLNDEDAYAEYFQAEINKIIKSSNLGNFINERINSYAKMLFLEHNLLYNNKNVASEFVIDTKVDGCEVEFDDETKRVIIDNTVMATSEAFDVDIPYRIIDEVVGLVVPKDEPYVEIQEKIHELVKNYIDSIDLWPIIELNKITQKL